MKNTIRHFIGLISFIFLLTGCGFHLRNATNMPPQLKTLYLNVDKPDTPFNQALRHLLLSLNVNLTQKASEAPLQLKVTYDFTHSTPEIVSSTQTVTYVYTLQVEASVLNSKGVIVVPVHVIVLSQTQAMNTTQIYTPNTASIVENELERDTINLLYFWLTNTATKTALAAPKPSSIPVPPVAGTATPTAMPAPAAAPLPPSTPLKPPVNPVTSPTKVTTVTKTDSNTSCSD